MSTRIPSVYLHDFFYSNLRLQLEKAQNRAQAHQWISFIQALKQKGVKEGEITDSEILDRLQVHQSSTVLTRDEVLSLFDLGKVALRESVLPANRWQNYTLGGYSSYQESIYVLESAREYIDVQLNKIRFELEELNFDLDALATNPDRVYDLDAQRKQLLQRRAHASDFSSHHFSDVPDPENPSQGIRNLLAHTRTSVRDDVFFIDELQSDWAQSFRRAGESERFPNAPFISNTEAWAGLILKRQLQRAALNPSIKKLSWITAALRNGSRIGGNDGLDQFYLSILPKIMNKFLKGTDEKVSFQPLQLNKNTSTVYEVPTVQITDAVRKKALDPAPLYSLDVDTDAYIQSDGKRYLNQQDENAMLSCTTHAFQDAFRGAKEMLSGVFDLRLVSHILHDETQLPVSGYFIGNVLNISLEGRDLLSTLDHELWHLAEAAMIDPQDVATIHSAFRPGGQLNMAVRQAMVVDGANSEAIGQCDNPAEASAYGFALWRKGKLNLTPAIKEDVGTTGLDRTVGRVFVKVEKAFQSLAHWVRRLFVKETTNEYEKRVVNSAFTKFGEALDKATFDASVKRLREHYEPSFDPPRYVNNELETEDQTFSRPKMRA